MEKKVVEVVMLWKKSNKFWFRIHCLFTIISMIMLGLTGCSDKAPKIVDARITPQVYASNENNFDKANNIATMLSDIYKDAVATNTLGSLVTMQRMVKKLGKNGYVAVDNRNQVDMTRAEQVLEFCKIVEKKKFGEITIIVITEFGFRKFDLKTKEGNVNIVRGYYQYDQNGNVQSRDIVNYSADFWKYTEEGYLIFEGNYFSDENFVLTLSDTSEHTMLRVLPLDEKCRELNRKYILPVGYEQNNLFLCNWSTQNLGDLDFYDLFDRFYPIIYNQPVPYAADENLTVTAVYQIPEDIFENVIRRYINVSSEILRCKTTYISEHTAYQYSPRGFYEAEYPEIAYPEVVSYTENQDGTITLNVNAVNANENTSKEFSHTTIIHPLNQNSFQYISNEIFLSEENYDIWWHSNRLTEEEKEAYKGDKL